MVELPLAHYRFHFRAEEGVNLPAFAGSAWRGAFGNALKRTLCVTRLTHCSSCPLLNSCAFPYLFEGRRPADVEVLTGFERVSVPFALRPPTLGQRSVAPGDEVEIDVAVFGRANDRLIYIVHALAAAGERGIGPGRGRLSLQRAARLRLPDNVEAEPIFSEGCFHQPFPPETPELRSTTFDSVTIHLHTPLRLKTDGKLITPEGFTASHFIDAAIRRISALAAFHAQQAIQTDYVALKSLAAQIKLRDPSLRWLDWKRYSGRQRQRMSIGGLIGHFRLECPDEAAALLPWIELAQWTGVGKSASMGLGRFSMFPGAAGDP